MRRAIFFLFLGLAFWSKAQFVDDFSDGDFSANPVWEGDVSMFTVVEEEGNQMLRSNAGQLSATDSYYLSTASNSIDDTIWEFFIDLRFSTSGANFVEFHLVSDNADLEQNQNGYFVRLGETADRIALYPIVGGVEEPALLFSEDKITENESFFIRVTRDNSGNWNLVYDEGVTGQFVDLGTTLHNSTSTSSHAGILIQQSTAGTPVNNHYFDDFFVGQDTQPPLLGSAEAVSDSEIRISFSEPLDPSSVQASDFDIDQGVSVNSAMVQDAMVTLTTSPLTNGRTYELAVSGVDDLKQNTIAQNSTTTFRYLVYSDPDEGELLLTEVLFNPRTDAVDFVELYNNSEDKFFNLKDWSLARISDEELQQINQISDNDLTINPGQYLALSEDSEILSFEYPRGESMNFVTIDDVPSYNDDEGTVVVLSPAMDTVQLFSYSDEMHYDLLEDENGVSLERVILGGNENDPNLWRSASSSAGFATPGKSNSQSLQEPPPSGKLTIEPKVFLPGNSGSGRDFTTINYELDSGGWFANVTILDQSGRLVSTLANGASLSTSGFFRWDGINDSGSLARMGYHIILFELYDGNGRTEVLKETVVVGRDF